MNRISDEFYRSEVRDGYYVPSHMKRCWASTLEVLSFIDRICRKYGLKYYADYGTLLGAVRHGGFIPWDDDFDICMKRDDYMKFLSVANAELPEGYIVLSFYSNPDYSKYLARVVNSRFIDVSEKFLSENHGFPFVNGVDIFPLDYLEENEEQNELVKGLVNSAQAIIRVLNPSVTDIEALEPVVKDSLLKLCADCGFELVPEKPIVQQLYILTDRLGSIYDSSAPKLMNFYFYCKNGSHVYPAEWFEMAVSIPFECTSISVPIGYNAKLAADYGPDYMTPKLAGGLHEYPYYVSQEESFIELKGHPYFPKYKFEKGDVEEPSNRVKAGLASKNAAIEIVFLPVCASDWKYMENEWVRYIDDPLTDVYVIPIPYYDRTSTGALGQLHYEAGDFPDYVNVTGFDKYDFAARHPHRIYIQNPYDDYDCAMSVHPNFYSENLRSVTDELVYIPCFEVMDFDKTSERMYYMATNYVNVPGVTRADRIILGSDVLRDRYIDLLCEFAGEETRNIWEEKIEVDSSLLPPKIPGLCEEEVPTQWWDYLKNGAGEFKKVLLYRTCVSDIVVNSREYIEKIRRNLAVFKGSRDSLMVIWQAQPLTRFVLEVYFPELWEEYCACVGEFLSEEMGIFDDSDDYEKATLLADAYYGDRDIILNECRKMGKPVMIQNVRV